MTAAPATEPMPLAAVAPVLPLPRSATPLPVRILPNTPLPTDTLVDELTIALHTYVGQAQLARPADLLPFLAKALVCHGWVTGKAAP